MKNKIESKQSIIIDNTDYFDFISKIKESKDEENIISNMQDINNYIWFLYSNSAKTLSFEEFKNKSLEIFSKFDSNFWLEEATTYFETILENIKDEKIFEKDLEYIIQKSKFAKGFRLFLIKMFSTRRKSRFPKSGRKMVELDPIIAKFLQDYIVFHGQVK